MLEAFGTLVLARAVLMGPVREELPAGEEHVLRADPGGRL